MKTPVGRLLDRMENHDGGINAALITNPEDVEYYSGFRGNGAVLFVHSLVRYLIVIDSNGAQQCTKSVRDLRLSVHPGMKLSAFFPNCAAN